MDEQLNLYDINKQIVSQLPFFTEENWEGAKQIILKWETLKNNKFYMLYGREINYFTLFYHTKSAEFGSLFHAIKTCLDSVGPVYAIDVTEDKAAIEIWTNVDEQVTCLYLFPYDDGVVYYE